MKKITLYILGRKGWMCLEAILDKFGPDVIDYVNTSEDEGMLESYKDQIIDLCNEHRIPVFLRGKDSKVKTNYVLAIGWRWMIHTDKQIITFHDSILPVKRGFAPLVQTLISGETNIGVTAILADSDSYDSGPVIRQMTSEIVYPIKISDAIDVMGVLYVNCVLSVIGGVQLGDFNASPQNHYYATYSIWRDDKDYEIDWTDNAEDIKRFIDAVGFPYKGATTHLYNGYSDLGKLRIFDAEVSQEVYIVDRQKHIGKVFMLEDKAPVIVCGTGTLKINKGVYLKDGKSIRPFTNLKRRFV